MTAAAVAARERQILFSGEMVRGIIEDRKTKTRRVAMHTLCGVRLPRLAVDSAPELSACPYGQPGDRLWVRETWAAEFYWPMPSGGERRQWSAMPAANRLPSEETFVAFRATNTVHGCDDAGVDPVACADVRGDQWKWRPSIFMPRWASRLTLDLTDVRVEQLQDISDEDAEAEGVFALSSETQQDAARLAAHEGRTHVTARDYFRQLWNSINASRGYGWDVNPWVWVLSFRKVDR